MHVLTEFGRTQGTLFFGFRIRLAADAGADDIDASRKVVEGIGTRNKGSFGMRIRVRESNSCIARPRGCFAQPAHCNTTCMKITDLGIGKQLEALHEVADDFVGRDGLRRRNRGAAWEFDDDELVDPRDVAVWAKQHAFQRSACSACNYQVTPPAASNWSQSAGRVSSSRLCFSRSDALWCQC